MAGLHVHISPGDLNVKWQLTELQRIARAALWFESAFEVLLTSERRGNLYARSLTVDNCLLKGLSMAQRFQWIGKCQTIKQFIWLMNPKTSTPPMDSMTFPPEEHCASDRRYGWNFENLNREMGGKGTIGEQSPELIELWKILNIDLMKELRRFPGVTSADLCTTWTEFAVNFVHSALVTTAANLVKYAQNVGGIDEFVHQSLKRDSAASIGWRAICYKHQKEESLDPIPCDLTRLRSAEAIEELQRSSGNNWGKRQRIVQEKLALLRSKGLGNRHNPSVGSSGGRSDILTSLYHVTFHANTKTVHVNH